MLGFSVQMRAHSGVTGNAKLANHQANSHSLTSLTRKLKRDIIGSTWNDQNSPARSAMASSLKGALSRILTDF